MRAKQLLNQKGIPFREIDISERRDLEAEMIRLTGKMTVPQILIRGTPVGGCDELYELERRGDLDGLLAGRVGLLQEIPMAMDETQYCLCCGEDVPTNTVYRDGNTEITCLYCGFVLGLKDKSREAHARCILTADDSSFIRNLLTQLLRGKGLAEDVLSFENGMTFLAEFNKRISAPDGVSLAILDLHMPVMDGLKAAMTMRAIEAKHQRDNRTPIVFFSARKCDEALKKQLSQCSPAVYFNKGESPDPTDLADRVDRLVSYILSRKK